MTNFYKNQTKIPTTTQITQSETKSDLSTDDKPLSKAIKSSISKSITNKNGFFKTILRLSGSLALNGSGQLFAAPTMDPSTSGEWSSIATLFDEFRVLSATFQVTPVLGSTTKGVLYIAFDNDDITAPTNIDEILSYQNSRMIPLYKGAKFKAHRPNITSSSYWTDVASPTTQQGSVKMGVVYGDPSVSSSYYLMTQVVEFRGRR